MMPTFIIIHHSLTKDGATVSWTAIRKYHIETKGWAAIGYNAGIELVGDSYEILLGRMPDEPGAHTVNMNSRSVGICVVGNYDVDELPLKALEKLVEVCRYFMRTYGIPVANVRRHSDYAQKSCPGGKFPWDRLIEALR